MTAVAEGRRSRVEERFDTFDALRIFAAVLVILSHSYPLVGQPEPRPFPIGELKVSLGGLAVGVFFATSGYLMMRTWRNKPVASYFISRRLARIWPGLIGVTLISAFVLGPMLTSESLASYLSSTATYEYVLRNVLMAPTAYQLPGVFENNPFSAIVNGSLWSLRVEVLTYLLFLVAAKTGILKSVRSVTIAVGLLACAHWAIVTQEVVSVGGPYGGFDVQRVVHFSLCFAVGMLIFVHQRRIPLRWQALPLALAAMVVGAQLASGFLFILGLGYLTLLLGTRRNLSLRALRGRFGDPSYGMYLYAFPLQQLLVHLFGRDIGVARLFVIATGFALLAGLLSWRLVENPGLRLASIGRSR